MQSKSQKPLPSKPNLTVTPVKTKPHFVTPGMMYRAE